MDLKAIFQKHLASGADISCLCTKTTGNENAKSEAHYVVNSRKRIKDITMGPPADSVDPLMSMNVFVMSKALLQELLSYCLARNLYHLNRDVLVQMKDTLNICVIPYTGYFAKLSSVASYFEHSMDLLKRDVRKDLFRTDRKIQTKVRDDGPTYYSPDSQVKNSLLADGCYIEGHVESSILFRGVKIEKGAAVSNCILMQDTRVCAGARLTYAIADKNVVVHESHMLMGHSSYPIAISKGSSV
jgi:glucose-1-phosphate adenylyltransferase